MPWPPRIGEPLPRAEEAYGIHEKLVDYSLKVGHEDGGPKADAFARILGITPADADYLATALLAGIRSLSVSEVRDGGEHGMHCQVIVPFADYASASIVSRTSSRHGKSARTETRRGW